jgi:tripartite-type tricarboxylate transporter receptor subunit TctC
MAESGYFGFRAISWNGLMAPAGTSKAIVQRIATEIIRAAKEQTFVERMTSLGVEPVGNSPEEFATKIAADFSLWPDALRVVGMKGQ